MSEIANTKSITRISVLDYLRAGRALWKEIKKDVVSWRHYARARGRGATNWHLLEAYANGIPLGQYSAALCSGATHAQIMNAHACGILVGHYAEARVVHATHAEILEAHAYGISAPAYGYARQWEVPHGEVLAAHASGIDVREYVNLQVVPRATGWDMKSVRVKQDLRALTRATWQDHLDPVQGGRGDPGN